MFAALLAVSLIPLLLCSALLVQIFHLRLSDAAAAEGDSYLTACLHVLDDAFAHFNRTLEQIRTDDVIPAALAGGSPRDTRVYSHLFGATQGQRGYARFDLYDTRGQWRYSTQTLSLIHI